jgi:predicted metal-dependent hydrolase
MKTRSRRTENTLEITGIGRVGLKRNHRARHLNLTVKPFTGVQVTLPPGIPLSQVEQFVVSNKSWIAKHIEQVREMEIKRMQVAGLIDRIDSAKAAETLMRELNKLADRHGFCIRKVTVRNQKTRWGSCSADNNISLNINLVHLPPKLLRYVLLHELLHTRIKNHGRKFWHELDRLLGNARSLRSQLNDFSYLLL